MKKGRGWMTQQGKVLAADEAVELMDQTFSFVYCYMGMNNTKGNLSPTPITAKIVGLLPCFLV